MYTSFSSNGSIWLVTQGEYLSFLLAYLPRKQIVKDLKIIKYKVTSMKYNITIQEDCYHAACIKHDEISKSKHLSKKFWVRKQKKETKWHTLKLRWHSIINCSWQLDGLDIIIEAPIETEGLHRNFYLLDVCWNESYNKTKFKINGSELGTFSFTHGSRLKIKLTPTVPWNWFFVKLFDANM